MPARVYYRGREYAMSTWVIHAEVFSRLGFKTIQEAQAAGCVRLRDHGHHVAIQARSAALCSKYLLKYLQGRKLPPEVSMEWPGRYVVLEDDAIIKFLHKGKL